MRNYFSECCETMEKIRENKKIMEDISPFLVDGEYLCNVHGNKIVNKTVNEQINGIITFDEVSRRTSLLNVLYYKMAEKYKVVIEKNSPCFDGYFVVISSSRKEYKIFSKDKVLTKYLDKEKLQKIIHGRKYFETSIEIPPMEVELLNEGICIEKRIYNETFLAEEIFHNLMMSFSKHIKETSKAATTYNSLAQEFEKRFGYHVNCDVLNRCPLVMSHGDLWAANVMNSNGRLYITDFEHVGMRYFLYDFFTYIYTEYFIREDDSLLSKYFAGEYDILIKMLFQAASVDFCPERKVDYFLGFMISIYNERWKNVKSFKISKKILNALNKYCEGNIIK